MVKDMVIRILWIYIFRLSVCKNFILYCMLLKYGIVILYDGWRYYFIINYILRIFIYKIICFCFLFLILKIEDKNM